jgi:cytochrome P450
MFFGIAVFIGLILIFLMFRRKKNAILGYPCTHPELGNFAEIGQQGGLYEFIVKSHKQFGPVFEFWLGNRKVVSIASIEMFKAVKHLADRPFQAFETLMPLVGANSVVFTNGAEYARRRKLLHAPFLNVASLHQNLVPKLNTLIADDVFPYFEAAAISGRPTKMDEVAVGFTMSAIVYLIGSQAHKEDVLTIIDCQNTVIDLLCAPFNGKVLSKDEETTLDIKLKLMRSVMQKEIAQGKISERPSLLKVYASETDEVVFDDTMTFMFAGFHTTSYLIQWSLYLAAKYPEEQEKLYRELISVEGDLASRVETLTCLRNFVDEVSRWAGIATFSDRECNESDIVLPGGYSIPRGVYILLSMHLILHDETLWDSPDNFMPDRFNDADSRGLKFCAFGFAGGRTCPGKAMALTEVKVFIAEVLKHFTISLPHPDYSAQKNFVFLVRPEEPIELVVTKR